jgi:hypothetical protein
MTKLRDFTKYDINTVPDEVLERTNALNNKLLPVIGECVSGEDPNIILLSLNRIYAAFIKRLVSDDIDQQKDAASKYANLLVHNVYRLNEKEEND